MHGRDQQAAQGARIAGDTFRQPHNQFEPSWPLHDRSHDRPGPGRLNQRQHLVGREPVAGDFRPVDDDAQQRETGNLLDLDVGRAGHAFQCARCPFGLLFQDVEIRSEDFDRQI